MDTASRETEAASTLVLGISRTDLFLLNEAFQLFRHEAPVLFKVVLISSYTKRKEYRASQLPSGGRSYFCSRLLL
jgi:hypothetical protein